MKINIEELLAKFKLEKQKHTALGLDIGRDSVKLVELTREGETIRLTKIDSARIAAVSPSEAEQREITKRTVVNLLAKNQVKSKDVILGVSGQSVFIKFLEILPVSADKLEKTIQYEAQQQIPFSLEEVEWDAHLFDAAQEEKAQAHRVLLVAMKKDKLLSKKTLVEGIKLCPSILDVSTISIYNCIRFNRDYDENKLSAVLNMGAGSSDLLILKGNSLWMRSFAIGGDRVSKALAEKFNIDSSEAEKLKMRINILSPDIKEIVRPVLEDLQGEIRRSIEYYNFQQKQGSQPGRIEEVLLSGGASLISGLDKFFEENLSCPVRHIDPFKMLHLDEEIGKKITLQNKALFAQAVGLALRGLTKSYVNINLLKEQIKLRALSYQRLAYGTSSVILALLILFGASTFMRQDYREKNTRLQRLKTLLNTFSAHQQEMKDLQEKAELLSAQVSTLRNLAQNRALWLEVSSQLQKMLPEDVWITELGGTISFAASAEENPTSKLDLQGKAASYEGVNSFISKLKSSTLFSEVKPLSSAFIEEELKEKETVEVVKFSISMKVLPKTK